MSTLRPGWLADDQEWPDQLAALDGTDAQWLADQWAFAGGPEPAVDVSWIKFDKRRWG